MTRVLEWRRVPHDLSRLHEHEYWASDWLFRHMKCSNCGQTWWETIEPTRNADLTCSCYLP